MAIAARTSGTVSYWGNPGSGHLSQTITKPSGTTTGDVAILVVVISEFSEIDVEQCDTPTGWTAIATNIGPTPIATFYQLTSVFYRVIQAGDATWTLTSNNIGSGELWDWSAAVISFSGCDTGTPIDATGTNSTATPTDEPPPYTDTIVANAVSVVTTGALWVIASGYTGGSWNAGTSSSFTAPGFTDFDGYTVAAGAASIYSVSGVLYKAATGTGSTGTATVSTFPSFARANTCIPFALRPDSGAPAAASIPSAILSIM